MKPSTRLSSAVFQLTPTRTRCDLVIIANGKKEKIASGLLSPFLAHLKTAQDQIAKGGYSILLEPEAECDAAWFTKATLGRFVRFVSTPEILERVYTIETEILQIDEAIAVHSRYDTGKSIVDDHEGKPPAICEAAKPVLSANEEKAIVLYKPDAQPPEANGSCSQEENSKVQLLKVLETRKTALQKEQGMAFARAVAAGFDIDQIPPLVSFAECFEARRLLEASSRFIDLWKIKHETGEWLDVEASEELSALSYLSAMNSSGIVLAVTPNKHDESNQASENNEELGQTKTDNPAANDQQEYCRGQFPHLMFPPWAMQASPGTQPFFPAYPVQGMPHYQAYPGSGPFFQPPHNPMEHSPTNFGHQSGQKRHSLGNKDGLETWEIDRTRSLDEMDAEVSQSQKPRKRAGGSNKKQSGMVVIRNLNYITSKEKKTGSELSSDTDSCNDTDNGVLEADEHDMIHHNSKKSSNGNFEKDNDNGHWQAFQNCLLRGSEEDNHGGNEGLFAMENGVKIKRRTNTVNGDPLALGALGKGEIHDTGMNDIHNISGNMSRQLRGSGDDNLLSRSDNNFRGINDETNNEFAEANGRKILSRSTHEDLMFGSQHNINSRNSSDPLAVNRYEDAANKMNRESSHVNGDEIFIVPFRSISIEHPDRMAIDIDSEIPSAHSEGNRNKVNYEPDDLSLMPERGTEKKSVGYDLALDYEMQVCAAGSQEKVGKGVPSVKGGLRKLVKDPSSKVAVSSSKQRTGGPIWSKSSKMTPLEDARARADSLRSYKADLQKMKKEKEDEQARRLEALKLERQKRIAARGSSTAAKPATLSPQTKKLPAKLSPVTNRGSKFTDSELGSSSPLQRSKIRISPGSADLPKASKSSKLSEGSHNRLTRSSSSLAETKKESNGVTPDSKASMARIRRLSEPKIINNPAPVASMKVRSAGAVSKRKLSKGLERNNISAIIHLDRSKAASLPELKIKTTKSLANAEHEIDADDNPIVEKTVVMLEHEKPSFPILHTSKANSQVQNKQYDDRGQGHESHVLSGLATSNAPPASMDGVSGKQSGNIEVKTVYSEKDPPRNITAEKSYRAPHARVSSLGEPISSGQLEYCKALPSRFDLVSRVEETVHLPDVKTLKLEKHPTTSEKTIVKESKGIRRLLKFGKKNPSSSVDKSVDSECTSIDGTEHVNNARSTASTSEAHTLKNLISQDEGSHAGDASQKTSRHFSLFSPFRNKSSEKKQSS